MVLITPFNRQQQGQRCVSNFLSYPDISRRATEIKFQKKRFNHFQTRRKGVNKRKNISTTWKSKENKNFCSQQLLLVFYIIQ